MNIRIFLLILTFLSVRTEVKGQAIEYGWFSNRYEAMYVNTAYEVYKRYFTINGFSENFFDANYIRKHKINDCFFSRIAVDTLTYQLTGEEFIDYQPANVNKNNIEKIFFYPDGKLKYIEDVLFLYKDRKVYRCCYDGFLTVYQDNQVIATGVLDSLNYGTNDVDSLVKALKIRTDTLKLSKVVWFKYFYEYRDSLIRKEIPNGKVYIHFAPSYLSLNTYIKDRYQFIYLNKNNMPIEFISFGETPWAVNELRRTHIEYDKKNRLKKVIELNTEFSLKHKNWLVNSRQSKTKILEVEYTKNKILVYENDTLIYSRIQRKNYILIETKYKKKLIIFKTNKRKLPIKTLYYETYKVYNYNNKTWSINGIVHIDTLFIP